MRSATSHRCFLERADLEKACRGRVLRPTCPQLQLLPGTSQSNGICFYPNVMQIQPHDGSPDAEEEETDLSVTQWSNRSCSPQIHHTYNLSLLPLILICLLDQTQHFLAATKPIKESINVLWPSSSRDSLCLSVQAWLTA